MNIVRFYGFGFFVFLGFFATQLLAYEGSVHMVNGNKITVSGGKLSQLARGSKLYFLTGNTQSGSGVVTEIFHTKAMVQLKYGNPSKGQRVSDILSDKVVAKPAAKAESEQDSFMQITAGEQNSCLLRDKKVVCWGFDKNGINAVPKLKNPRQLTQGNGHACALDDTGVVCWGRNDKGQAKPPDLKDVIQIAAGGWHTCALTESGAVCWGLNNFQQLEAPALTNPLQIVAHNQYTCVLTDQEFVCWGDTGEDYMPLPSVKNPRRISLGSCLCVLDDTGLNCGRCLKKYPIVPPGAKDLNMFSSGDQYVCVLDGNEAVCSGMSHAPPLIAPPLKNPKAIASGTYHACVVDNGGVVCWGNNNWGQSDVPKKLRPRP